MSATVALVTIIIGIISLEFVDYVEVARLWYGTEYREFFIALGIAVYAIDVVGRYTKERTQQ